MNELSIIESATSATLNTYATLKEKFDFGEDFNQFKPKGEVTENDIAAGIGMSSYLSERGFWIQADAIGLFYDRKQTDELANLAAALGLEYSTISARHRTGLRTPVEFRSKLKYTTCVTIATSKFSKDEAEDTQIRLETFQKAVDERWNSSEARGAIQRLKGIVEPVTEEKETIEERIAALTQALQEISDYDTEEYSTDTRTVIARRALNIPNERTINTLA